MLITITVAAAGGFFLTPLAERLAVKCGAVSHPDMDRRTHERPTAQWGGLAVYTALLLAIAYGCYTQSGGFNGIPLPLVMAISAGLICALGAYDDIFELRARWKVIGQVAAIMPVLLAGYYFERLSIFGLSVELGWTGAIFTTAWMLLAINAMNLIDGMDGLASIIGITMAVAIAVIAGYQGQQAVMILSLSIGAALAGFLGYNLPPARIYLGDCGSMVLGFALSLLAIRVSFGSDGSANATIFAVIFIVPLLDTGLAILRRTLKGESFTTADREHVHHKLLDRGIKPTGVLAALGGLCALGGLSAWLTATAQSSVWTWFTLAAVLVALVNRRFVGHQEWEIAKQLVKQSTLNLAGRLAVSRESLRHEMEQTRTFIPKFHWKIVGNSEIKEPVEAIHAIKEDKNWVPPENKAA